MTAIKTPNSRRNLDEAIKRAFGADYLSARTAMANAIVGSLLPEGAVKGGSALKLRFGDAATRFTTDLDAARVNDLDSFIEKLEDRLEEERDDTRGTRRHEASRGCKFGRSWNYRVGIAYLSGYISYNNRYIPR